MKLQIEESELVALRRDQAKLHALEEGGVDNWEFYDESLKQYRETIEHEKNLEKLLDDICGELAHGAYEPSERGAGFAFEEQAMFEALEILKKRVATLNA